MACFITTACLNGANINFFKDEYTTPQIIQNHPKKTFALGVFLAITGSQMGYNDTQVKNISKMVYQLAFL